jgi:hypothetical protein
MSGMPMLLPPSRMPANSSATTRVMIQPCGNGSRFERD